MKRSVNTVRKLIVLIGAIAFVLASLLVISACTQESTSSSSRPAEQKRDSDNILEYTCEEMIDYGSGVHHAELIFAGYEDRPLTLEIYSNSASVTAKKFCRLVDRGFYNGKPMFWILKDMYVRMGESKQDNAYLITGEYEESDVSNSNSLKRGVVAMNRAEDGQQSVASSLIVFMSDLSFLDGKYAGFARITKNYEVIEQIAELTTTQDESKRIPIDDNGKITNESKYPIIESITMVD